MSISITGVARVTSQPSDTRTLGSDPQTALTGATDASTATVDAAINPPAPPRFPWLSRLSAQLEPTAKQKPAFPSAPQLGDNLDQAA
jgi:hypothetical protein